MAKRRDRSTEAKTEQGTETETPPVPEPPTPFVPASGSQSQRASELWKLLATDPEDRPGAAERSAPPAEAIASDQAPHWAGNEMGELLARAWEEASPTDTPPGAGAPSGGDAPKQNGPSRPDPSPASPVTAVSEVEEAWNEPAAWVVDPIPSAAEGGVLAMFTTGARAKGGNLVPAGTSGPAAGTRPGSPVPSGTFPPVPPPWAADADDGAEHSDRDRLVDMLDNLPGPLPRVGAGDITVDDVAISPVTVWLWGDDDIYPGRAAALGASSDAAPREPVVRPRGRFGR